MKKQKVILLVVILLLCVILASIILNQNKIIKKESITIKEMSESTQVIDLQEQINQLNTSHTEYANYVQSCKETIATAITNQGVNTSADATAEVMAENIGKILEENKGKYTINNVTCIDQYTATMHGQQYYPKYTKDSSYKYYLIVIRGNWVTMNINITFTDNTTHKQQYTSTIYTNYLIPTDNLKEFSLDIFSDANDYVHTVYVLGIS